ncbi:MAG TPA: SpoIIE family protein phosphatase [Kofleriaceae bacterium]
MIRNVEHRTLVAVIDALGHGPTAAVIAAQASSYLSTAKLEKGVLGIMEELHAALSGTRGAAAMVLLLAANTIEGCSVGNVDLRALGSYVPVVQSPGILGVRVRRYHIFKGELTAGSRLAVFSDGISSHAPVAQIKDMGAKDACEFLLQRYRRSHDDATILVIDVKDEHVV